jgi:hypothetical protein
VRDRIVPLGTDRRGRLVRVVGVTRILIGDATAIREEGVLLDEVPLGSAHSAFVARQTDAPRRHRMSLGDNALEMASV